MLNLNYLANISVIVVSIFMGIMLSNFPTISNCSIKNLAQIKRCNTFLSEFHYKGDNIEDRDNRKINKRRIEGYFKKV